MVSQVMSTEAIRDRPKLFPIDFWMSLPAKELSETFSTSRFVRPRRMVICWEQNLKMILKQFWRSLIASEIKPLIKPRLSSIY